MGVLSPFIFILWVFCPMEVLSMLSLLCPPTWSHDKNVDCPNLYHVVTWTEMGSYTFSYWSIKISSLLGVLSTLIFILCGFCLMVLMSILAFLSPPTGLHDKNVDCPHLYHVITWTKMWSSTLIVGVLKCFLFWRFCPLSFWSFDALSYFAFVHFGLFLSAHVIAWRECWLSTPVSCDHMNRNWIVQIDCLSTYI